MASSVVYARRSLPLRRSLPVANLASIVWEVFLVVVRACASYDSAVYLVCVLCGRCALM
jgi:hypothetical protein